MSSDPKTNRALVLDAMTALFQRRDVSAVERLYAADYVQHNPQIAQGREALTRIVAALPPTVHYEPGLVIAEGAYVAIHGRIRGWAAKPQIVVDIFRVADGKLAEHWDVLQDEVQADRTRSGAAMFSPDEAVTQATAAPTTPADDPQIDYDAMMQANLTRVFGEPDVERRLAAIRELYADDAVLNEPHASVRGHLAICDAVTALLAGLPPEFSFSASGPAIGHHGVGRLRWSSGRRGHPAAVTGMDIAHVRNGRIQSLTVFLDPP
jgi:predicted SnoaL-like aldol condensation-catalyzing enzyme/ketosteroid isomerase-like protein